MMQINKRILYGLLPFIILLTVFVLVSHFPLSDFAGYYFGSKALLSGDFMGAYDMEQLNFNIAAEGYKGVFVSYAPFPPFTSLLIAPFTLLPVLPAKILFTGISSLLALFTLYRFVWFAGLPPRYFLLLPVVFCMPLLNNILFGQAYLLLLSLLLEGYMAFKKEKIVLASVLWAIAIAFKVFPAVIVFYLLLHKKYRPAILLCIFVACLVALSVWINGFAAWEFYVSRIMPKLNNGELNHPFTPAFQSAFMLCKKLFVADHLLNPDPFWNSDLFFIVSMALFRAFVLSCCILCTTRWRKDDFLPFALWILGSLLLSPNGSSYSLVLLIFPFFALGMEESGGWRPLLWFVFLFGLIANLPVGLFAAYHTFLQFPRLYLLILLFGFFIWRDKQIFRLKLFAVCFAGLLLIGLIRLGKERSGWDHYLLQQEKDLFIYDYTVREKRLFYHSLDEKGVSETETEWAIGSYSEEGVSIRDNQVWYKGKQFTASPDTKKKASLMNGSMLVYLSDKDRGVGFYTLRFIPMDQP